MGGPNPGDLTTKCTVDKTQYGVSWPEPSPGLASMKQSNNSMLQSNNSMLHVVDFEPQVLRPSCASSVQGFEVKHPL